MTASSTRERVAGAERPAPYARCEGPVLAFGGPYGNLEATQALLAQADKRGIPPSNIVCTGDLVAYCADPQAVVDVIRDSGIHVIAGNCEEALVASADDCGCGFSADSACAYLSGQWFAFADRHVDATSREWMATLPGKIDIDIGGFRLAVVHGGFAQSNRFVFASDEAAIRQELASTDADGVIAGHCGLPFTRVVDGRVWHNPGVIGMPANDGAPRVWFSIIEPSTDGLVFEHHALDYDHGKAAARLRENNLPEGYAACLENGLWPSLDILGPEERARRGMPLAPGRIAWRPGAA